MASDSADSAPVKKTALVCLGDRKREVEFAEGSNEAFNSAVFDAYSDVLVGNEKIVFQLKREDWAGEFIDMVAGSPVPDRSVLRAVVVEKGGPSEEVSYILYELRVAGEFNWQFADIRRLAGLYIKFCERPPLHELNFILGVANKLSPKY